jgi:hypothetical protein
LIAENPTEAEFDSIVAQCAPYDEYIVRVITGRSCFDPVYDLCFSLYAKYIQGKLYLWQINRITSNNGRVVSWEIAKPPVNDP